MCFLLVILLPAPSPPPLAEEEGGRGGRRRLEKPAGKRSLASAALEQKSAKLCASPQPLRRVRELGIWPRRPWGTGSEGEPTEELIPLGHVGCVALGFGPTSQKKPHVRMGCYSWDREGDMPLLPGRASAAGVAVLTASHVHLAVRGCLTGKLSHCFFFALRTYLILIRAGQILSWIWFHCYASNFASQ